MTYRSVFNVKAASIPFEAVFDFSQELPFGETVASASLAATVYSGLDPAPQAIVSGTPTISGREITQILIGGVVGVVYELDASVVSSGGHFLTKQGLLCVTEA